MHLLSIRMHASSPLPHPQSGEASFRFEEQQPQIREKREGGEHEMSLGKDRHSCFSPKRLAEKSPSSLFGKQQHHGAAARGEGGNVTPILFPWFVR